MILKERFIVPPFSILDSSKGYWQNKKNEWLSLGIKSEIGRDSSLTYKRCGDKDFVGLEIAKRGGNISIFDPVLCELMYKWFCPEKGKILDPFAGGSVRGIVAEKLGYKYTGVELRKEQVNSNNEQSKKIGVFPKWFVGDGRNVDKLVNESMFDMIFTCPPYFNLEVYSDLEEDLSNARSYDEFLEMYEEVINKSLGKLMYNRFFVIVISNVRDKNGFYLNLVGDTISIMKKYNVFLYNDVIFINPIGSLTLRVNKFFSEYRKLGKIHQNILIFFKGADNSSIKVDFTKIDFGGHNLNLSNFKKGLG